MKQIKIGTCVPGTKAEEWLKGFVGKGFETFSINFHMSLEGTDLDKLALTTDKLLAGTDSKITTLGYYCNPIQYAEHRKTLEKVICTAEKFGATHVSTFAGAWEGKPVESEFFSSANYLFQCLSVLWILDVYKRQLLSSVSNDMVEQFLFIIPCWFFFS